MLIIGQIRFQKAQMWTFNINQEIPGPDATWTNNATMQPRNAPAPTCKAEKQHTTLWLTFGVIKGVASI